MSRGVKKTLEQEKLEGCPGRRPINENAPTVSGKIPNPPTFLDPVAKRKYYDLTRIAGPDGMRVAGASDGETLAMIAHAYSEFRSAKKVLDDRVVELAKLNIGPEQAKYYRTPSGQIKLHPAAGEVREWWTRYQSGLSRLGMTPYDRKNVDKLPEEKKTVSRKDELRERRELIKAEIEEKRKDTRSK